MIFLLTFRFSYEKNYSLIVYHVPVPLLNALFFIISFDSYHKPMKSWYYPHFLYKGSKGPMIIQQLPSLDSQARPLGGWRGRIRRTGRGREGPSEETGCGVLRRVEKVGQLQFARREQEKRGSFRSSAVICVSLSDCWKKYQD